MNGNAENKFSKVVGKPFRAGAMALVTLFAGGSPAFAQPAKETASLTALKSEIKYVMVGDQPFVQWSDGAKMPLDEYILGLNSKGEKGLHAVAVAKQKTANPKGTTLGGVYVDFAAIEKAAREMEPAQKAAQRQTLAAAPEYTASGQRIDPTLPAITEEQIRDDAEWKKMDPFLYGWDPSVPKGNVAIPKKK